MKFCGLLCLLLMSISAQGEGPLLEALVAGEHNLLSEEQFEQRLPQALSDWTEKDKRQLLLEPNLEKFGANLQKRQVIYINGVGVSHKKAQQEAEVLSRKLERPVWLFYNGTVGFKEDLLEAANDKLAPLLPRPTFHTISRELAHLLVKTEEPLNIVSHSQGTLITRNALLLAHSIKPIRHHVAWVATGMPMKPGEIYPEPLRFHALTNRDDHAARALSSLKLDPIPLAKALYDSRHDFEMFYLEQIDDRFFFEEEYQVDKEEFAAEMAWAGVWESGKASVTFREKGVVFIDSEGKKIIGAWNGPQEMIFPENSNGSWGTSARIEQDALHWNNGKVWRR